jgi:hypothetical protein
MTNPIQDQVRNLTLQLTDAQVKNNFALANEARSNLKALCMQHEGTSLDHPFQWEMLGDLAKNDDDALAAYQKGFECAKRIGLPEHAEKIKFAMAETYFDQENIEEAHRLVSEVANDNAKTNCNALKMAVKVFFGGIRHA